MRGSFKHIMIGNEIHYSRDFSLEQLHELHAFVCPLHATLSGPNRNITARPTSSSLSTGTRVNKTQLAPLSRSKHPIHARGGRKAGGFEGDKRLVVG